MNNITLKPLDPSLREDFIYRNQTAFMKAASEHFGVQEKDVISKEDILRSLDDPKAQSFSIFLDEKIVGGVVVNINPNTQHNSLDLLFIDPKFHSQNIGAHTWALIEAMYPDTECWETHTPYFETRNIHFYVNKCGFHIVEFFNPKHPEPHEADAPNGELFFRFEKQMK